MNDFKEKVKFFVYTLDLGEVALIQIAATALGVLLGANATSKSRKVFSTVSIFAFIAASLPVSVRFFKDVVCDKKEHSYDMDDDCFEIVD